LTLFANREKRLAMKKRFLKFGILSQEEFKERMLLIVQGKIKPKVNEPKIFFESLHSAGQILSGKNKELLKVILEEKPATLKALAELSGRKTSSLSRTLKTMEKYGIITLQKSNNHVKPIVNATDFRLEMGLFNH
jgi:predicted transcriptional regulator